MNPTRTEWITHQDFFEMHQIHSGLSYFFNMSDGCEIKITKRKNGLEINSYLDRKTEDSVYAFPIHPKFSESVEYNTNSSFHPNFGTQILLQSTLYKN